ncbi:NACHT domain-containing protein [Altericista sp. CCNU0014]|uniref:NACHT C-terminal helical domain 2-containing protein n=1 Tax=Altericista sp. CCNU0014 TaxID=3082949 RepID=UPI00384B1C30
MARRSLKASPSGIATLRATLKRKRWSQKFLADVAGCSRQTIWSLSQGNPIDAEVFLEICTQLGLAEHEIAEAGQEEEAGEVLEIDELVRQVRAQIKPWIHERCGWMNVLSMTRPIGLGDIYTDVNILEKITGHKRLALKELEANCLEEDFDRFGFSDLRKVERVPGLDAVDRFKKMIVLGKPGAGKTTFLKRIVTQCNLGTFHPSLVPIFVPLKQFAENQEHPGLFAYIANQLAECRVKDAESKAKTLLYEGRALVLLDGLDEVEKADCSRVIEDIRRFSEQFYKNFYVLTCRIATQEFKLEQFTEVEIADFDDQQIAVFVTKWFELRNPERTESFLRKLNERPRIRELATNPLLLTLLCLGFEETGYFSDSRAGLYKEGLNVLLKGWDAKRGIDRDIVYRQLTPDRKEDLLSQLAYQTFEEGRYFFGEEIAKRHISQYIKNLPSVDTDVKQLDIDSEAVLRSIEGQHGLLIGRSQGIYSFSHLTFQEYFTARKIAASCNPYSVEDETLQMLAQRVTDKRWREVLLLVAEILPSADCLLQLMKQKIDTLLTQEDILQKFLEWVQQKTNTVEVPYKSAAVRAYYFSLAFTLARTREGTFGLPYALAGALEHDVCLYRYGDLTLDYQLAMILASTQTVETDRTHSIACIIHTPNGTYRHKTDRARDLSFAFELALHFDRDSELNQQLQQLRAVVLKNSDQFKSWWEAEGQAWAKVLRATMIKFLNIGHDWKFTSNQIALLQQYLDINLLLVNCLNSNCYVERSVRTEIEDTLLLPISEIKKRKLAKKK